MTDRAHETHPDSPPADADRGSVESLDKSPPRASEPPDPANGSVGGTDGVVRNQDDDAQ